MIVYDWGRRTDQGAAYGTIPAQTDALRAAGAVLFLTLVFFLTQILIRGDWVLANMPFAPPEMKAADAPLGLDDPLGMRYVPGW